MSEKISNKDKKDWEDFLSKKEPLQDKESINLKKNIIKSKYYDFHGFSLEEANKLINKLIKDSYKIGVKKLIIVTGKGIHSTNSKDTYVSSDLGKLKFSVPEYIKNNQELRKYIVSINSSLFCIRGKFVSIFPNLKKILP